VSKRRRIRPHERAKIDQRLAAARNLAASGRYSAVFAEERAEPGTRCCWCDCPFEQHLSRRDDGAGGCEREAYVVVHLYSLASHSFSLCRHHHRDFIQLSMARVMPAGGILEMRSYNDVYDIA
jgi:hypothetical protein